MGVKQTEAGSAVVVVDGDGARVPVSWWWPVCLAWCGAAMMPPRPCFQLRIGDGDGDLRRMEMVRRSCEEEGRGIAV